MAADMVTLGLALLLVGVVANYGNYRKGIETQLNWVAAGGLMFLLSSTWTAGVSGYGVLAQLTPAVMTVFQGLGVLFALVGAVWAVVRLVKV